MKKKVRHILFSIFIGFSMQTIAVSGVFQSGKNQKDSCFVDFKSEYKSLHKAIDKLNKNYSDNYLHVLYLYNYDFNRKENTKQWDILSSALSKTNTALENAKDKKSTYCPNIADIYMMKAIILLYQQNYIAAYQLFDTVITHYPDAKNQMNAYLWLAHTAIYMETFDTAKTILQTLETELDTTNIELNKRYEMIVSDFFIKTYDYETALNHLLKIETMPLSDDIIIRAEFIIAQIYDHLGHYQEAASYFEKVNKHRSGVGNLMKSYSIIHEHLCEKLEEENQQRLLALADAKKKALEQVQEFEPTVVESFYDSTFSDTHYPYYFNDAAAMFFLDESAYESDFEDSTDYPDDFDDDTHLSNEMLENIFGNWESIAIHIPKTDFSSMTDTIYVPLINPESGYILPKFNQIVSRFGWRRYRYHYGVDTKNALGDSIFCAFDGIVRIAKRNKTYGNVIIVRHYNGLETFYAHCSKLLVEPNQEVKAGELIAFVGNTGRSRGPHLHFETRYKGAAFNPEYIIDFEKGKLISDTLVITKETFNYLNSASSSSTTPATTTVAGAVYYKIRQGDTLSTIAARYKTSVNNIKRLNGLKSDFIREGQRIRVL